MNPSIIFREFLNGKVPEDLTSILFVACADEWSVDQIMNEVPESMSDYFRNFIMESPDSDTPVLGLDGLVLKKAWLDSFKAYYNRA